MWNVFGKGNFQFKIHIVLIKYKEKMYCLNPVLNLGSLSYEQASYPGQKPIKREAKVKQFL